MNPVDPSAGFFWGWGDGAVCETAKLGQQSEIGGLGHRELVKRSSW